MYFNTLTHLRTAVWFKRQGILSQEVILIRDNVRPHAAQFIEILLKYFHWEQFKHPPCSPDLVLNDYHLFPRFKR